MSPSHSILSWEKLTSMRTTTCNSYQSKLVIILLSRLSIAKVRMPSGFCGIIRRPTLNSVGSAWISLSNTRHTLSQQISMKLTKLPRQQLVFTTSLLELPTLTLEALVQSDCQATKSLNAQSISPKRDGFRKTSTSVKERQLGSAKGVARSQRRGTTNYSTKSMGTGIARYLFPSMSMERWMNRRLNQYSPRTLIQTNGNTCMVSVTSHCNLTTSQVGQRKSYHLQTQEEALIKEHWKMET